MEPTRPLIPRIGYQQRQSSSEDLVSALDQFVLGLVSTALDVQPNSHGTVSSKQELKAKVVPCKLPQVPTFVIRFEDLQRYPAQVFNNLLHESGVAAQMGLSPEMIYERAAFVSNITKDLDPGNAANCRGSFDYVASSPTAARAAMEILSQNEEILSKLGYAYELN
eukprot:CAMPEP_0114255770 /NCGR_PEP_ID=MMETSP0058-20121206/17752_1 /TAXON_ID=36894 /ORGANISM="Pyramimonas parkeae, CCMP726" /LENGTH=165 /DNA_ID=CAMNT_0001370203 /DNA_START=179 /DNA_END=677 /DNA_ORIENTATION=+